MSLPKPSETSDTFALNFELRFKRHSELFHGLEQSGRADIQMPQNRRNVRIFGTGTTSSKTIVRPKSLLIYKRNFHWFFSESYFSFRDRFGSHRSRSPIPEQRYHSLDRILRASVNPSTLADFLHPLGDHAQAVGNLVKRRSWRKF